MHPQADRRFRSPAVSCRKRHGVLKTSLMAASSLLLCGLSNPSRAQAPAGMGLVWADEFSDGAHSATPGGYWAYDTGNNGGWGNGELENYTTNADNAHEIVDGTGTDDSAMQIKATYSNGVWYSARLKTAGRVSFGPYGYFEARCKFPNAGDAYWPAFWMLGNNIGSVGWPTCGEVDIAEECNGQWQNHQSLHMPGWNPTLVTSPNSATTTYHTYGANWQPGYVAFYVDGSFTGQFSRGGGGTWEFDNQTMYVLLNLAVGGSGTPFTGTGPDGSTQGTGYFDVDYVRQYENGAPALPSGNYEITASTTGNALDCYGNGNTNGTAIQLWPYAGTNNQRWNVTNLGNGYYSIRTINPDGSVGRSLDCTGGSPNDGTYIELWDYWGGSNQQWQITQTSGGRYVISTAQAKSDGTHDVLDGQNCSGANNARILLWNWGGGGCQQPWEFIGRSRAAQPCRHPQRPHLRVSARPAHQGDYRKRCVP